MDALGHAGEEGRFRPRKSTVSCQKSVDPYVSEWGNPINTVYDSKLSEVGLESTRRELKHLSTSRNRNQIRDTLSSGERNGLSLNRRIFPSGLRDSNMRLSTLNKCSGKGGHRG
jgi:hypothetical protein